jgi:hypothetical protein
MVAQDHIGPTPPLRLPSTTSPAIGNGLFVLGIVYAVAAILLSLALLAKCAS